MQFVVLGLQTITLTYGQLGTLTLGMPMPPFTVTVITLFIFDEFTVSVVEGETTLPKLALTFVAPAANEVASPLEPAVLLNAATVVSEELHVTEVVISCVELSENVAVAVNCCVAPKVIVSFVGVILKDATTANVADPEMLPDEAVMVILIVPVPDEVVTSPVLPIGASVVSEELQVTEVVISCVVPSE